MPRPDSNLLQLERAAAMLGALLDELTLVGGCAGGLLIQDPAAARPRPTYDVDFIVEAATYTSLQLFGVRLIALGFQPSMAPGAPLCRWERDGLAIDVMPIDERALGFSNRWYPSAVEHRVQATLPSRARIHHVDAAHFLATKLEAFESRGQGDAIASHDLEDLVRVVDGREEIVAELGKAPPALQSFVSAGLRKCLADRYFLEALPGYFSDLEEGFVRARFTERRLRDLATLTG